MLYAVGRPSGSLFLVPQPTASFIRRAHADEHGNMKANWSYICRDIETLGTVTEGLIVEHSSCAISCELDLAVVRSRGVAYGVLRSGAHENKSEDSRT